MICSIHYNSISKHSKIEVARKMKYYPFWQESGGLLLYMTSAKRPTTSNKLRKIHNVFTQLSCIFKAKFCSVNHDFKSFKTGFQKSNFKHCVCSGVEGWVLLHRLATGVTFSNDPRFQTVRPRNKIQMACIFLI